MDPNRGQTEAWNGEESAHYIAHAHRYDRQLASFTETSRISVGEPAARECSRSRNQMR